MRLRYLLALGLVAASCGSPSSPRAVPAVGVERAAINVRAFARLYGVVRWFHPSDEAAAADWDRMAVLGVARVRGAVDSHALAIALESVVAPIAPSVQILERSEAIAPLPPIAAGDHPIWWQHAGPGLVGDDPPYVSKRRERTATRAQVDSGFGAISQSVAGAPYRGKRVRVRARLRATGGGAGQMWLRVDRPGGAVGFFDNMDDRPVTIPTWTSVEITGEVAADADRIVFGGLAMAGGAAGFDDFELAVEGARGWEPVAIANPGFEQALAGWSGSTVPSPDTVAASPAVGGASGAGSAQIATSTAPPRTEEVFEDRPAVDEVTVIDLGDGLVARVPLVVPSRGGATVPAGNPAALAADLAALEPSAADPATRLADVVITWNVFAHFYPYLDVIGDDWNRVLDDAIRESLFDRSAADHAETLDHLLARAQDGHAHLRTPGDAESAPPIEFDWVEGSIVVTSSGDPNVQRGDIVATLAGAPARQRLAALEARTSGSPQWRRVRALRELAAGAKGESLKLGLVRAGAEIEVAVPRGDAPPPPAFDRPEVAELEPGIWYIDLGRAAWPLTGVTIDQLAAARGVVFDARGYPNGNHDILAHVVTRPDTRKWMHVARMVRPFQRDVVGWESYTWELAPAQPHLGNVVFITGPGAISYAESVLGYVERDGIPIVGAASAGANGNVQKFRLPGGAQVSFTGMRVTRHDGGQRHLFGVRPTIAVAPTIAGVAAGRDELLERAIQVVRAR